MSDVRQPNFYWTKVWTPPDPPSMDGLCFNSRNVRDSFIGRLQAGDIIVYLASNVKQADPKWRGCVAGALEIEGSIISAQEAGRVARARPEDFNPNGSFRWPYCFSVSRSWHMAEKVRNEDLVPGHAPYGLQGAATIHRMKPDEVARFLGLAVVEQNDAHSGSVTASPVIFRQTVRRPWRQRAGQRAGGLVQPGCGLYVAHVADHYGFTFKVGSGHIADRLAELNLYRRPSQREPEWSVYLEWEFCFPDAARDAEDHLVAVARAEGFSSPDHSEFIVGMTEERLRAVFSQATEIGDQRDRALAEAAQDGPVNVGPAD